MYQSTTSLGLAQVHLRSPKVVVATGAAAPGSKNGITFFAEVIAANQVRTYSSPLTLPPYSVSQIGIKFGIGLVDVRIRMSTYKRSDLLQ